jgi:hypothetical protein
MSDREATSARPPKRPLLVFATGMAITGLFMAVAGAQPAPDRERQQLLQLQQQVQRLQRELTDQRQASTRDIEQARREVERARADSASQLRSGQAAAQRDAKRLADELAVAREAVVQRDAELERMRAEVAQREAALQQAARQLADTRSALEADRGTLAARLKANAQRADACEAKHAQAMALSRELIDDQQARRATACEPFTGLWRVGEEERVQSLRDRLFEARLDVPPPETSAAR